jgi:separase
VTDKDIDRLSEQVCKNLLLDAEHLGRQRPQLAGDGDVKRYSTVQALNMAREECKMKYLTGAAPVCYGIPIYSD